MLDIVIAAAVGAETGQPCHLPFEVVATEAAARAVAKVVIASAPARKPDRTILRYDLKISYVEKRRSWRAWEVPVSAVAGVSILGGGGLDMEIAACDGAVAGVTRQV